MTDSSEPDDDTHKSPLWRIPPCDPHGHVKCEAETDGVTIESPHRPQTRECPQPTPLHIIHTRLIVDFIQRS
jgi:hypothetical protein